MKKLVFASIVLIVCLAERSCGDFLSVASEAHPKVGIYQQSLNKFTPTGDRTIIQNLTYIPTSELGVASTLIPSKQAILLQTECIFNNSQTLYLLDTTNGSLIKYWYYKERFFCSIIVYDITTQQCLMLTLDNQDLFEFNLETGDTTLLIKFPWYVLESSQAYSQKKHILFMYGKDWYTHNRWLVQVDTQVGRVISNVTVGRSLLKLLWDDEKEVMFAWVDSAVRGNADLVRVDLGTGEITFIVTVESVNAGEMMTVIDVDTKLICGGGTYAIDLLHVAPVWIQMDPNNGQYTLSNQTAYLLDLFNVN